MGATCNKVRVPLLFAPQNTRLSQTCILRLQDLNQNQVFDPCAIPVDLSFDDRKYLTVNYPQFDNIRQSSGSDYSVYFWVQMQGKYEGIYNSIVAVKTKTGSTAFDFYFDAQKRLNVSIGTQSLCICDYGVFDNKWRHLGIEKSRNLVKILIDGIVVVVKMLAENNDIGRSSIKFGGDEKCKCWCKVDDFMIFDGHLNAANGDIIDLMKVNRKCYGVTVDYSQQRVQFHKIILQKDIMANVIVDKEQTSNTNMGGNLIGISFSFKVAEYTQQSLNQQNGTVFEIVNNQQTQLYLNIANTQLYFQYTNQDKPAQPVMQFICSTDQLEHGKMQNLHIAMNITNQQIFVFYKMRLLRQMNLKDCHSEQISTFSPRSKIKFGKNPLIDVKNIIIYNKMFSKQVEVQAVYLQYLLQRRRMLAIAVRRLAKEIKEQQGVNGSLDFLMMQFGQLVSK